MNLRTIERVFELPMKSLEDPDVLKLPETQALLKMIEHMPWLVAVAEHRFDPYKTNEIMLDVVLKESNIWPYL